MSCRLAADDMTDKSIRLPKKDNAILPRRKLEDVEKDFNLLTREKSALLAEAERVNSKVVKLESEVTLIKAAKEDAESAARREGGFRAMAVRCEHTSSPLPVLFVWYTDSSVRSTCRAPHVCMVHGFVHTLNESSAMHATARDHGGDFISSSWDLLCVC